MQKKILRFLPMLFMMAVIFFFSAMPGEESSETSGFFLSAFVKVFEKVSKTGFSVKTLSTIHLIIRKLAHFTEYAVFGITVSIALKDMAKKRIVNILIYEAVSFLYAATDELHQYFVPGRYGTFSDVLIDSGGALFGIIIFAIFLKGRRKNAL